MASKHLLGMLANEREKYLTFEEEKVVTKLDKRQRYIEESGD